MIKLKLGSIVSLSQKLFHQLKNQSKKQMKQLLTKLLQSNKSMKRSLRCQNQVALLIKTSSNYQTKFMFLNQKMKEQKWMIINQLMIFPCCHARRKRRRKRRKRKVSLVNKQFIQMMKKKMWSKRCWNQYRKVMKKCNLVLKNNQVISN